MPILPFSLPGRILSFVGGGGKSTLMYALAREQARLGQKVLVTTTTRIFLPDPQYYAANAREAEALWASGSFAVIGTPVLSGTKLAFPEEALWADLSDKADVILVEADGSRHHPMKVPRSGEPVLLPQTDAVVAVLGLSAMGQPWQEVCFGLDVPRAGNVTEEAAADLLASPEGSRKGVGPLPYFVVLNQADTPLRRVSGEKIAALLARSGISQTALTTFSEEDREILNSIAKGRNP